MITVSIIDEPKEQSLHCTTVVTTWEEWMTVETKMCLPVTIASTWGEQRRKLTIVNAQPFKIAHLTVCLSMLLVKILKVTYRPVWQAVSALYYHQNIYPLMCIHWCHSNKNDLMCLMLCITLPAYFAYFRGDSVNKEDKSNDRWEGRQWGLSYEASKGALFFLFAWINVWIKTLI